MHLEGEYFEQITRSTPFKAGVNQKSRPLAGRLKGLHGRPKHTWILGYNLRLLAHDRHHSIMPIFGKG